MTSALPCVGWIGLGRMGTPMARNLLDGGYPLSVYNRSPGKVRELVDAGAMHSPSLKEVGASSRIVFSMIADDPSFHAITIGDGGVFDGMAPGTILVDMSTVSPAASALVAARAQEKGIRYLRAPVSGSTALAAAGGLTILVSGERDAFDECQDALSRIGKKLYYLGDAEQARYLKLSINMMVGITAAMMGEALALSEKGGVDWCEMIDIINNSAVASPLIGYKAKMLKERDFTPMFAASQMAKDLDLALDTARTGNVPLPVTALVRQFLGAMVASGDGEADFFSYVTLLERLAGLSLQPHH